MARILHDDDWFEEIGSQGHYEYEFEAILEQEAGRLFRNYHFVPFKLPVYSDTDHDTRAPDFALIHRNYGGWWVVEVELAHHSFDRHVLPQVRTLSRATYGPREANYLCRQDPSLDRASVMEMLKGRPPRVLVIVNAPVDRWAHLLSVFEANVVICQVYRSSSNNYLLRITGDYPTAKEDRITTCECVPGLYRLLTIHQPARLLLEENETMLLYHDGHASEWERVETKSQVFLHAMGDHNLRPGKSYEIVQRDDGTFAIRPSSSDQLQ